MRQDNRTSEEILSEITGIPVYRINAGDNGEFIPKSLAVKAMQEYADQEKRKAFNEALDLANPNEEFLYLKELNEKRIKAYKLLGETYNISESSVADIFCKGIDFAKREIKQSILNLKIKY